MKILIVKLSSLGDVVHTLPLVSDILKHHSGAVIDWVVEDQFSDIPAMHQGVSTVISVAMRRWRKNCFSSRSWIELWRFLKLLRTKKYDLIIDGQGLIKSALIASIARGPAGGLGFHSSRELISSIFYKIRVEIKGEFHAIVRLRILGAKLLGYSFSSAIDFGLVHCHKMETKSVMFFHGTTWPSKFLPEKTWIRLSELAIRDGFQVLVPSANDAELERARRIVSRGGEVLPKLTINELVKKVKGCAGIITIDTGLGHLAQALGVPTVALFGPTDPKLTGIFGNNQLTLASNKLPCAPCLKRDCMFSNDDCKIFPPCFSITPEKTWKTLQKQIQTELRN
ncbi:MAG: lipopolysaccharide heptosyltransferase I [Pseudomonadota bacterium]|nr:lipopolysaccharide heptosyltransferase I [Pseudomonadota bacterium]